jgi:hypothetical protein
MEVVELLKHALAVGRNTMKSMVLLLLLLGFSGVHAYGAPPAKPSKMVMSSYPRLALLSQVQGDVRMVIELRQGMPKVTKVLSGPQILADSAAALIERWRFDTSDNAVFEVTFRYEIVGTCPVYGCETDFEWQDAVLVIRTLGHRGYIN